MAKKKVISHYDFVRDLDRGAAGEEIAEVFLEEEFGVIVDNISKRNPDFDLIIDKVNRKMFKGNKSSAKTLLRKVLKDSFGFSKKDELTIEVKYDQAAARYGNFFIEIFFNIEDCSPGTAFNCKADMLVWVVPRKKKKYSIYLFNRAKFLAWIFDYIFTGGNKIKYKTPSISPKARGVAIPIELAAESAACIGEYKFTY